MTSNLPVAQADATLDLLGGQAALWADPRQLLDFDDASLRHLAAEVGHEAGSVLAQVRRAVGLVAWAAWYRMTEKDYRAFAEGLAGDLDIEVETLRNWRRAVVRTDKLPVPGVAGLRAGEAAKGRKTAGQPKGALSPTAPSGVIPAVSTEAPTKTSEGKNGAGSRPHSAPGDSAARLGSPSDPPSGGAELQPSAGPTDEPPPSSRPAPPGSNPTGPVPSLRQEASTAYRALHESTEGIGAKWTIEEATYWQNRTEREMDAWRKANRIDQPKPERERRQPKMTRPQAAVIAGRAISTPANGSLTRRDVTPMFKP